MPLIVLGFLEIFCTKPIDHVILATVGSTQVTSYNFIDSYSNRLLNTQLQDSKHERDRHLNELIRTKLFAEAARNENTGLDSSEKSMIQLEKEKALREALYNQIIGSQLSPISDSLARLYFQWQHTEVHLKHLFHKNKAILDSIKSRLIYNPELFDTFAVNLFKNNKLKNSGGDLGWISYNTLDPALEQVAFAIPIGKISNPVRSSYGWHIILKVNEKRQMIISEDDYQIQKTAITQLVSNKQKRILADEYVNNLMTSGISINDSLVIKTLSDIHWIITQKGEKLSEMLSIADGEIINNIILELKLNRDLILAHFPDGRFTINDLLSGLRNSKPKVFFNDPTQSFYIALRDKILTTEAIKKGLKQDITVQLKTKDAEDRYLARGYLLSLTKKSETPHFSSTALKDITKKLQSEIPITIYQNHLNQLFIEKNIISNL